MTGNSFNATGVQGITYQYDVRKVNASDACPAIRSNGITMTDASVSRFCQTHRTIFLVHRNWMVE